MLMNLSKLSVVNDSKTMKLICHDGWANGWCRVAEYSNWRYAVFCRYVAGNPALIVTVDGGVGPTIPPRIIN